MKYGNIELCDWINNTSASIYNRANEKEWAFVQICENSKGCSVRFVGKLHILQKSFNFTHSEIGTNIYNELHTTKSVEEMKVIVDSFLNRMNNLRIFT
jgi:hypothetical protein